MDPAAGGPPSVVSRLAAAEAALGHEVCITAPESPGREGQIDLSLRSVPGIERVKIRYLARSSALFQSRAAREYLDGLIAGVDVVHMHGVWGAVLKTAGALAHGRGIPYVVAPHGTLYPWSLKRKRLKKQLGLLLGYRRMLNEAAALHALNVDEEGAMRGLGLRPEVVILPNGVFPAEIDPLPERGVFRAAHPVLNNKPFILFLSRLHPGKGLIHLADAFEIVARENAQVQLVVAGPDSGAKGALEDRLRQAGLEGRAHLTGPIYGSMKMAALVDATCFCLPSEHETFSMAITEALACGLPVVISENCHYPEVTEVGAGEVVRLDAKALAGALGRIIGDAGIRQRMGQAGRALVTERFTWPRVAERAVGVYERIRASGGCRPACG